MSRGGLITVIGVESSALAMMVDGGVVDAVGVSCVMAFAASGAKVVDVNRDNTRRRRVMLSASLN